MRKRRKRKRKRPPDQERRQRVTSRRSSTSVWTSATLTSGFFTALGTVPKLILLSPLHFEVVCVDTACCCSMDYSRVDGTWPPAFESELAAAVQN